MVALFGQASRVPRDPYVIPAEAGIQALQSREARDWTPAFAAVTITPLALLTALFLIRDIALYATVFKKGCT